MELNQYLQSIVNGSKILEKSSIHQSITILWTLREGVNREGAENYLVEIQNNIKNNFKGPTIEFKIVDEIEIIKEEIEYVKTV